MRVGPIVFGVTLILLSLHPAFVATLAGLIPIQETGERPLFASLGLVLLGLAFVAYGSFFAGRERRASPADGEGPSAESGPTQPR